MPKNQSRIRGWQQFKNMKEVTLKENQKICLYSTIGTSMFPFICWNEHIVVKNIPPQRIEIGDIILFSSKDNLKVAHRVVEKQFTDGGLRFQTKGDHNNFLDEPVSSDRIAGKVVILKRKNKVFSLPSQGGELIRYKISCFSISVQHIFKKIAIKTLSLLRLK